MNENEREIFDVKSNYKDIFSDEYYEDFVENFEQCKKKRLIYRFIKRSFDLIFSLLALILSFPFFLIIALIIKIDSRGPVFFVQKRMGKGFKPFNCLKFRTMMIYAPSDVASSLLKDADKYYTHIGRFLRKTSLDELPQLFNILTGKMSFIGYRPLVLTEEKCNEMRKKMNVFSMRPGITGYAQINGRDQVYYKNKAIIDAYYVKHASLWFDIKIIFKSFNVVIKETGNDASEEKKKNDMENGL